MNNASHKKPHSTKGRYVERVTVSKILVCKCGGSYIKTRKDQETCVKCMYNHLSRQH